MATMASLLKATMAASKPPVTLLPLKWRRNPPVLLRATQNPHLLLPSIKMISTTTTGFIKCSSSSRGSNFSLQCVMNSSKNCFMEEEEEERKGNQKNPFERFAEVVFKALQKAGFLMALMLGARALIGLTALLFGLLHSYDPATAASRTAIILGVMLLHDLYRVISAFSPDSRRRNGGSIQIRHLSPALFLILIVIAAFMLLFGLGSFSLVHPKEESVDTQIKTTVLKLQVALLGTTRSLQRDIDRIRIAGTAADTSTSKGFSKVLQETTSALLRQHPDYCISGYSSVDVKQNKEDGQKHFNKLSIEERGKSDAETLVSVNNSKGQSTTSNIKIILITMLVAAEGVHELPAINGCADLKVALQKLGSISSSKTMAVEVLWTPRNENDTLTERGLLEDYPLLRPL